MNANARHLNASVIDFETGHLNTGIVHFETGHVDGGTRSHCRFDNMGLQNAVDRAVEYPMRDANQTNSDPRDTNPFRSLKYDVRVCGCYNNIFLERH